MSVSEDFMSAYNRCRCCGKLLPKPKEFCDETCQRAYRLKDKVLGLFNVQFTHANKSRLKTIFNMAKMLENGWSEQQIRKTMSFWFTLKTIDRYLEVAKRVVEVEKEQKS